MGRDVVMRGPTAVCQAVAMSAAVMSSAAVMPGSAMMSTSSSVMSTSAVMSASAVMTSSSVASFSLDHAYRQSQDRQNHYRSPDRSSQTRPHGSHGQPPRAREHVPDV